VASVFSASSWMIYIIHDPNNCPSSRTE